MLIKTIESKVKLALVVSVGSFISAIIIAAFGLIFAFKVIDESNNSIYVLDNGLPLLVKQTSIEKNRPAEYKGAINTFHTLFFTLPPDDEFIKYNIEQAMYYIDDSGLTEYNNLKEKGYYNSIIGSSAVLSIKTDSIAINMEGRTFRYYGTQRIERKTTVLFRELVTEGSFQDIPRTNRNSFGVLIKDWKTILNRDIKLEEKRDF